jgi:ABC-type phosphate/phosphonate transport system substrate-binding protein
MMKQLLAMAGVGMVLAGAVGCGSISSCGNAKKQAAPITLKIGVCDPICRKSACSCVADEAIRAYDGMNAKLAGEDGITLEMEYFEEPVLLEKALKEGKLDGIIAKSTEGGRFVRGAKREFMRLADITKPTGGSNLRGVFITFKDSPVKTLADIQGHVLGLGPKEATEKVFLPEETLAKRGIVPASKVEFFDCKSAALALMENKADVAVISDYALQFGCIVVVGDPKDFHVIAETDRALPFTTFMVDAKRVPAGVRTRLAAALLTITGDKVPKDLFSKGWVKPVAWPQDIPEP